MKYFLYTDGAARGNPGPGGAGVYLTHESGEEIKKIGIYLGTVTNNVAEYQALLIGIESYLKHVKRPKQSELHICMDSELVVRQVQGQYKVKNPHLQKIFNQVMEKLGSLKYVIRHVPREENDVADQLANEAIDEIFHQ